ncbi:MAG: GH3 auxin-responsive promoter family protein [Lachnospiraceae bacterium]|nr:GH3 auxin-responsive promoter family protein [Lachnospiraceae bacterium]
MKDNAETVKLNKDDSFIAVNRDNLKKILFDNRDTEYGKKYGFGNIDTAEEYIKRVPLSRFSDYEEAVDRMMSGQDGVLTSYPVYDYAVTSGSAGKRKVFPVTYEALERYGTQIDDRLIRLAGDRKNVRLFVSRLRKNNDDDVIKKGPKLLSELYYAYQSEHGLFPSEQFAGGSDLTFVSAKDYDYLYAKLWTAFSYKDILTVEGLFLYDLLIFFNQMKKFWKTILSDMEAGSIPDTVKLTPKLKEALIRIIPDKGRIEELKNEFSRGMNGIAKRIFPELELISGIGSLPSMTEEIMLKTYTGDIPVSHFCFVSSECHMGVPVEDESFDYRLLSDSAFFEFLSDDENSRNTVLPGEVIEGRDYEIVITTFSGLYRYATGDVVTVTGFSGENPLVRFKCRRDLVLNVAGEKTDEYTLDSVMRDLAAETVMSISGYLARADISELPGKYEIMICTERKYKQDGLSSIFDRLMIKYNKDYEDLRNMGSIGMPAVTLCGEEEYRRSRIYFGMDLGHLKPVHILL